MKNERAQGGGRISLSDQAMNDLLAIVEAGDDFNKVADILNASADDLSALAEMMEMQDEPDVQRLIAVMRAREAAPQTSTNTPQP